MTPSEFPVPSPYPRPGTLLQIRCFQCQRSSRGLAIKHHSDKHPDDPLAEDRFKSIAITYQTLSDPTLRKKYNEFGPKESTPEGGYVDPEEVFGAIFGADYWSDQRMKSALQEAEEASDESSEKSKVLDAKGREVISLEERARREEKDRVKVEKYRQKAAEKAATRAERVSKLVENLERKLGIFTESATIPLDVTPPSSDLSTSWRTICSPEAADLSHESYGAELLHCIGFVYVSKAKHHLATKQTLFGVGDWLHNVQGKYHVFTQIGILPNPSSRKGRGNLSPEEKKGLEEQAAEKGLQTLFKGTKLEVESILRETCDRLLSDPAISREKVQLRAVAPQILGEVYLNVKKDVPEDGSDYVKTDTKSSHAREGRRT
ncbi:uncharacterized protein LACBIDRAFT_309286 [Laccaria bicolor S238N-H82]|uniref:Predicted protein n=1 Tax=Laccaria bicolor (strain S238N-H82 / ATCC MYA-4686) TaxID=486041 RepID=B0CW09_LACBS|nr:uncharacterized protein LACBIDRAFT_309286 [Laccaria bicolor S238N-H82]EDR13430.1 predicted protein [Laccaria bicolor S238N-H82]|eukprot:XP_001875928.1 predicted protein [Laccaria bicolor S238N-H82]